MPIIIPPVSECLGERLSTAGAATISQAAAEHQDIRPARIGLLNLMPAAVMETTEIQWLRYMSHTVLQINPLLIKFDDDFRERDGASRSRTLNAYNAFSDVAEEGLDGLIITGDNIELANAESASDGLLHFGDVKYTDQLGEIVDWAQRNVRSTIYSCWASHFALNHLFGLNRVQNKPKLFGVYEHAVTDVVSPFTMGMDDTITAPHSRWGNIPVEQLYHTKSVQVLAVNGVAGWLLAQADNKAGGMDLFIQGHPEYDRHNLDQEYLRDRAHGQAPPDNYYHPITGKPQLTWANDARSLHANWVGMLYESFASE